MSRRRSSCCTGTRRALSWRRAIAIEAHLMFRLDPNDYGTNILLDDGLAWFKSEASIRMAEGLGWPWALAKVFRILPLEARDRLYELIAESRLRIFGKRSTCYAPAESDRDRFIS